MHTAERAAGGQVCAGPGIPGEPGLSLQAPRAHCGESKGITLKS